MGRRGGWEVRGQVTSCFCCFEVWGRADPGGAAPPGVSQFLEILSRWLWRMLYKCKPTKSASTPPATSLKGLTLLSPRAGTSQLWPRAHWNYSCRPVLCPLILSMWPRVGDKPSFLWQSSLDGLASPHRNNNKTYVLKHRGERGPGIWGWLTRFLFLSGTTGQLGSGLEVTAFRGGPCLTGGPPASHSKRGLCSIRKTLRAHSPSRSSAGLSALGRH